jgi:hypothetical protein
MGSQDNERLCPYTVKAACNGTARAEVSVSERSRLILVFEVWILGTLDFSAKVGFPLCPGPV